MKPIFTLLLCAIASIFYAQSISADVTTAMKRNAKADCILVMSDQLDMYGKTNGLTKNQKARKVYNALHAHATRSQKSLITYLDNNGISHQSYFVFNGIQAELNQEQLDYVLRHFDIGHVAYNEPAVKSNATPSNSSARMDAEWGITKIKADSVWALGYEGQGVVIAGQDTGYDFDNALILNKYRGYNDGAIDHSYNWHDAIRSINPMHNDADTLATNNPCGLDSSEPCDDNGHGTHTMGTMVGKDADNLIGVAPQAKWIGCRNMERGYGTPTTYTECFQFFLAPTDINGQNPDPNKAPHVINNSWGCPEQEGCNSSNWSFMETVVNNLTAAGVVVVVSAGNDGFEGCGSINAPATIFQNSFTVGSTNKTDVLSGFSSLGPVSVDSSFRLKPDIVAPGEDVRSISLNNTFASLDGTSMAGPHVAGLVALMISAKPELAGQVDEIKEIIKSTAVPLVEDLTCFEMSGQVVPNFLHGHGRIDALAAIKKALDFTSTVEVNTNQVEVYPNPTDGKLNISGGDATINKIQVLDIAGRTIYCETANDSSVELNLSRYNPGVYIYKVATSKGISTGKFILNRK